MPTARRWLRFEIPRRSGISPGDLIQKVDNKLVKSGEEFQAALQRYNVGDTVTLTILRNGEPQDLPITLDRMPDDYSMETLRGGR